MHTEKLEQLSIANFGKVKVSQNKMHVKPP